MHYNPLVIDKDYIRQFREREMNHFEILGIVVQLMDWGIDIDNCHAYSAKRLYIIDEELYLPDFQIDYYINYLYMAEGQALIAQLVHYSNEDDTIYVRLA